ncbi:MAG: isoprenyl transferase [Bacteroidetes bacterium]|nr:MAG: isoprenyl transferase [Bacteroidota bacterium]
MSWVKEQSPDDKIVQENIIKEGKLPKHIAVIMDGNGRWALERGLSRTEGHQEGIESVRDIVKASSQIGVKYLTLYAFSIENWKRPITEVGVLMKLLEHYLRQELEELHNNNVRLLSIGKSSSLPKVVQRLLHESCETTKDNTGLTLTLALSYSGRWDIVRAVQMIALDVRRGKVSPEDINEDLFSNYLQTKGIPEPDLLIRTSGEMRLSNFLLWEMAYGEMYITDKYWPEFRRNDLYDALLNFMNRERRFGKTSAQVASENYIKQKDSYLQRVVNAIKGK